MGTAQGKSLMGSRVAIIGTALLMDPTCCQWSPQGLCDERLFAEASVAGGVSEWPEVEGKCHFSPSAMHDHVIFVCKLTGGSFPWGLAWLLASAPALLCSQAAKSLLVPQRGECGMASDRRLHQQVGEGCCQKHHYNVFIFFMLAG